LTPAARNPTVRISQQLNITLSLNLRVRVDLLEIAEPARPMLAGAYSGELLRQSFPSLAG